MIFSPKWEVTEQVFVAPVPVRLGVRFEGSDLAGKMQTMRSTWPILICGLMHLSMVSYGLSQVLSSSRPFVSLNAFASLNARTTDISEGGASAGRA